MPEVSPSALAVPHSRIRDLAELAIALDEAARRPEDRVLRLYFGESNLPTPRFIQEAATKAMADGFTTYTHNAGLTSTRDSIAAKTQELHGVKVDPSNEVVVTGSGVQALNVGIRCCVDPGDEVIVLTPAWQNQISIPQMFGARVVEVPLRIAAGRYQVDFDALDAAVTSRTKLLIYTSPSNPTGWTATLEEQQGLLEFGREHGLWILADEVYERLWYEGREPGDPAPSLLRLANRQDAVFSVNSVSKSYCMTGWRIGWLVARKDLARRATQLNEFIISSANAFAQRASETALSGGESSIREMLAMYRSNRDLGLEVLRGLPGVTVPEPSGAFYLFFRVEGLRDSFQFCKGLLEQERVGLAPGVAFGRGGDDCIRLCYAVDREQLSNALGRIARHISSRTVSSLRS
jgi:aspartate/methionine/tyrosine aminotransferase